jgi:hypothetical protein
VTDGYAPTKRANRVADWIEIECLSRGKAMGVDALHVTGKAYSYGAPDVAMGLTTMSRRATVMGHAYPFKVASGAAAVADASKSAWVPLLLMSSESPLRSLLDVPTAAAHLERITAEALTFLYGPGTLSVRFAWPSEEGRPPEFPDAIRWLADRMKVRLGAAYRPPYNKDGGVDVVAWRPFPDGRSGFPVLLAQCTLERDYARKAADVDTRVWSGWLALDVDPATALAVPDVVAAGQEWNALAARTVILDRVRLATLLREPEQGSSRWQTVTEWTASTLTMLKERR